MTQNKSIKLSVHETSELQKALHYALIEMHNTLEIYKKGDTEGWEEEILKTTKRIQTFEYLCRVVCCFDKLELKENK